MDSPIETYLLASDSDGRQIVSVHVKKTYKLETNGRCVPAEKQMPLLLQPIFEEGEDKEPFNETDIIPYKNATDLIVMAQVFGRGRTRVEAGIRVGDLNLKYVISGPRRCIYKGKGAIQFTAPEVFDAIPMRYENAYGGVDHTVPDPEVKHVVDMFRCHPGVYPRNPVGRGYVVYENKEAIDGLELPNIEHPEQMLTPVNLAVGDPNQWWRQPLPWSCDWFDKGWYPRIIHFRGIPDGLPDDDHEVMEVRMGWVDPFQNRIKEKRLDENLDSRLANAASPALVLPFLQGDEAVELTEMAENKRMVVTLPGQQPQIQVKFEGGTSQVSAIPNRVLISTEEMGVYVVWHGAWYTPRLLPDRMPRPGASPNYELEGIEVLVDGNVITPLG